MGRRTAKSIETAERERRAVELALAGKTFEQIAEDVGYASRSAAWGAVQRALKRTVQPAADEYRAMELMRLDRMLVSLWPLALGDEDTPPDYQAVDRVLKVMDRRAKLLGLDAPVTINVRSLVAEMAKRHNLAPDEARVCVDRIEEYLASQRVGVAP